MRVLTWGIKCFGLGPRLLTSILFLIVKGLFNLVKSLIFLLIFVATTSYAQLARNKCKFLGNIIADSVPSDFYRYWNQVTPENGGKWGSVEATQDVMDWHDLDRAYHAAKDRGLLFKQHTFVWGQQQPNWIGTLAAEEQAKEVEEWIMEFCERYPDTDLIDVVNEPLHETPVYAEALGGAGESGYDWVIWAFEKAKEHCPKAKRILNDYGILNDNNATDKYITLINLLQDRGLIDYIGEQGHFFENVLTQTLTGNLDKLQATKLPVLISEYDVNIAFDEGQALRYQTQFAALWEHPAVQGITLWGYQQGATWQKSAHLIRIGLEAQAKGPNRPALTWLKDYVPHSQGGTFCITGFGEKEDDDAFAVYPNPSNGNFSIQTASEYVIRDILGRPVGSGRGPASLHLEPGLYIIQSEGRAKKLLVR